MLSAKNRITRSSQLADQIRCRIQSEGLKEGDFFMTEALLAEEYGVSRSIVREAVGRLSGLGILEGRQRKGLVVLRPCPVKLLSESIPSLAGSHQDIEELLKLRLAIELGSIELAVAYCTDEQIDQLDDLAGQFQIAVESQAGNDKEDEIELEFHGLLLRMTGSTFIAGMQKVLGEFFKAASRDKAYLKGSRQRAIWQHRELVTAIRNRDVDLARSLMRLHFQAYLSSDKEEMTNL